MSPADIEMICLNAIKEVILSGKKSLKGDILEDYKRMLKEHSGEIPPSQKGAKYAFIHAFEDLREITPDEKKGIRLRKKPLKEGEIALYGDLKKCIDVKTFNPELWIFSARVCDENGDYDEEKLPETQLRDAIEYFVSNYDNVRVVNLSIGDPKQVYRVEEYQFRLAAAIDELAFEYKDENILFVVSAGNYKDGRTVVEYLEEETGSRFPNYLLNDSRVRIIDPATSALALTVGSLSLGQRSTQRWFAKTLAGFEEFPSPLTRTGPCVNGMLKPELVEFGGDLTIERGSGIVTDPYVGVITTEKDFLTEGLFRVEDGTSFSAAKVSHLAANLWNEFSGATPNKIKALLIASAKIPKTRPHPLDEVDLKSGSAEEQSQLLNIYGHGLSNLDRAFSAANRALLIDEREIKLNDIVIYEIPVPKEFYKGTGRRTLAITLAFDPPTRRTRKQYLGVTMEFHLFKVVDVETIEKRYGKLKEFAMEEENVPPSLERNKIDLVPGVNLAKKVTIQKRMWILDRAPKDTDESLKLVVICNDKWINDEEYRQRYAVVVTVEQQKNVKWINIQA